MAQHLAELCGGRLVAGPANEPFEVSLTFPALGQLPVLAIDDNVGTLNLLQRYTAGTRYRLVGIQDPEQALRVAEQLHPQIVVLDVMMPRLDGWEVLGRLLQHPVVGQLPIVVCTILAQEELALALGAERLRAQTGHASGVPGGTRSAVGAFGDRTSLTAQTQASSSRNDSCPPRVTVSVSLASACPAGSVDVTATTGMFRNRRVLAHLRQHLMAVHPGHGQVEQHDVGVTFAQERERARTGLGAQHPISAPR